MNKKYTQIGKYSYLDKLNIFPVVYYNFQLLSQFCNNLI